MNQYADLHIHSNHSDGAWSPERILEEASKRNLNTIAITDHDTVSGSVLAWNIAFQYSVNVIVGIEFSCSHNGEDVHMLGYFLRDISKELEDFLYHLQQRRRQRALQMVQCFMDLGIDVHGLDWEKAGDSVGRPHFAKELIRIGAVKNFEEAFDKYLKKGRPCYIEKAKVTVPECIEIIHRHGGAAVVAHPGFLKNPDTLDEILTFGPDGLEVYHSKHDQKDKIHLYNLAKRHGLLITGGSDFHEETKSFLVGIGTEKIPMRYVEDLIKKIQEKERNAENTKTNGIRSS